MNSMQDMNSGASRPTPETPHPGTTAMPPNAPMPWGRKAYFPEDSRQKSPALATLMSLVPGLGQVYVGYYRQGFVNILIIASLITLLSRDGLEGFKPLAAIFMVFFWLYNLVDAARKATLYNQSLIGLGAAELPEDIQKPKGRDTLIGGSFLILLGLILLLHTRFGFSLEWVERWWPIALVVAGAYLVSTAYMDRNK